MSRASWDASRSRQTHPSTPAVTFPASVGLQQEHVGVPRAVHSSSCAGQVVAPLSLSFAIKKDRMLHLVVFTPEAPFF